MKKKSNSDLSNLLGINNVQEAIKNMEKQRSKSVNDTPVVVNNFNEVLKSFIQISNNDISPSEYALKGMNSIIKSLSLGNPINNNNIFNMTGVLDATSKSAAKLNVDFNAILNNNLKFFNDNSQLYQNAIKQVTSTFNSLIDNNKNVIDENNKIQFNNLQLIPFGITHDFVKLSKDLANEFINNSKFNQITEVISNFQNEDVVELYNAIKYIQEDKQEFNNEEIKWLNENIIDNNSEENKILQIATTERLKYYTIVYLHYLKYEIYYNLVCNIILLALSIAYPSSVNFVISPTKFVLSRNESYELTEDEIKVVEGE